MMLPIIVQCNARDYLKPKHFKLPKTNIYLDNFDALLDNDKYLLCLIDLAVKLNGR